MNEQLNKNRRIILILFALSVIPFVIAWYMSQHPEWMKTGTNKGELITPVVVTERSELTGFDEFSRENISELSGHWVLVNIIDNKECDKVCQDALLKTRQLRLMMNKDLTRIRRMVVLMEQVDPQVASRWWQKDLRLLRVVPSSSFKEKIRKIIGQQHNSGWLILMDPLGNLMMKYQPGFDPYDVKKDLGKLLRISQIG